MLESVGIVIPCRDITSSVRRRVGEALTNDSVAEIVVTVNGPGPRGSVAADLMSLDRRITIRSHGHDIGLYSNFRSGIQPSREFTAFFAEDDEQPPGLIDQLVEASDSKDALILPRFVRREWCAGEFSGGSLAHENVLEIGPPPVLDPSYINGLWRTEFLFKYWPDDPFDWLDFCLITRALAQSRCRQTGLGPAVLGFTPGKAPHAVSGSSHSSSRAAIELLRISADRGSVILCETKLRLRFAAYALRFFAMGCALNRRLGLPNSLSCRVWWSVRPLLLLARRIRLFRSR